MKRISKMLVGWAVLTLSAIANAQEAAPQPALTPYVAIYSVGWGANTLGEGSISLAPIMDKDCYRFESQTKPVSFVRWFYGSPRETSIFCLRDGVIRAQHFEYVNDKREKDNFTLDFDWKANKVKTLKKGELTQRELADVAYDRFVLQQALRLWVMAHAADEKPEPADFVMVDDDRIVTYRFAITGREMVETPAGTFDALRVERINDPRKSLRSWLAPARDYIPVKIERIEDGEVKLRMLLK